ncbi:unnamed protein product [Arctogadus glacialis]
MHVPIYLWTVLMYKNLKNLWSVLMYKPVNLWSVRWVVPHSPTSRPVGSRVLHQRRPRRLLSFHSCSPGSLSSRQSCRGRRSYSQDTVCLESSGSTGRGSCPPRGVQNHSF